MPIPGNFEIGDVHWQPHPPFQIGDCYSLWHPHPPSLDGGDPREMRLQMHGIMHLARPPPFQLQAGAEIGRCAY